MYSKRKMNICDEEYFKLINHVLSNGEERIDRTGTGTLSCFGYQMRFDLTKGFPLITSKRVFFRGVVEELLWILRGNTNANDLNAKGVKIWNANGTKEFLEKNGLEYEEGHLGPVYGHQWRHFNAKYVNANTDYNGQGIDQIKEIIELIKYNPESRRIILSGWNPCQNKEMALPPCHTLCQFYVNTSNKTLSCQLYQRSGDVGLGVPFNIASYALLTHIIAKMTDLEPKEFIHVLGDAHIYLNHKDILTEQLKNETYKSPRLIVKEKKSKIEEYTYEDFDLTDYKYSPSINMSMAV